MHDVVEFLGRHAPFDELDERELERLGRGVEVEYFPEGETIFRQQEEPIHHVRVVRRGSIELVDQGRVLDLLGEGELFGHPSMLSGQPTDFEARAHEDTLCYRLPADSVAELLAGPVGLRFVARTLKTRPRPDPLGVPVGMDSADQTASALVRREPVVVAPETSITEAAGLMGGMGGSVLVRRGEGRWGIVTAGDLRRVVAEELPVGAPVTEVMSEPVFSVTPDRFAAEVVLEMLERGIRHVPVISPSGEIIGVLDDVDLLAAQAKTPFALRRAVADAGDPDQLDAAAAMLAPTVISLYDARVAPRQISAIIAVVADALTARAVEFAISELGGAPAPLSWFALGSHGRREPVPGSDIDSALSWKGGERKELREYMKALGARVGEQLAGWGFAADSRGATASRPLFVRSDDAWRELIAESIDNPREDKGLIVISLLLDGRLVYRRGEVDELYGEFRSARNRRGLSHLMLRLALHHKPPTGFLREFVVEHSGEHKGTLDIKHGGLLPITSIARYAAFAAGSITAASTPERLNAAAAAGTLEVSAATILVEAFDLLHGLRLEHQVEQLRRGSAPDDHLDPRELNPLTRSYLREAFNEVRAVQKKLGATELGAGLALR
jgi:CBS domain-containing protein